MRACSSAPYIHFLQPLLRVLPLRETAFILEDEVVHAKSTSCERHRCVKPLATFRDMVVQLIERLDDSMLEHGFSLIRVKATALVLRLPLLLDLWRRIVRAYSYSHCLLLLSVVEKSVTNFYVHIFSSISLTLPTVLSTQYATIVLWALNSL